MVLSKLLGMIFKLYEWKEDPKLQIKTTAQLYSYIQISQAKRVILTKTWKNNKIHVKGEAAYNLDTGVPKLIEEKKSVAMVDPKAIRVGIKVNKLKIKHVANLL